LFVCVSSDLQALLEVRLEELKQCITTKDEAFDEEEEETTDQQAKNVWFWGV
jgi:hypothetical protein